LGQSKLPNVQIGTRFELKQVLFPIIEDKVIEQQISKLGKQNEQLENIVETIDLITIDDFRKIQLKSAKVLDAQKVPKSEKLLKLQIQIGDEIRQLVAGIAKHYQPEDIIGKTIIVVANLKPAKLFGLDSQGMLLAAKTADGRLSLLTTMNSDFPSGAEVS
jgi:methionyl-tRNA synthetase C-terminal region/beta chain